MRKLYIIALTLCCILLSSCNQEKKVTYYSDIYSEKPTTIFLAPTQDNSARKIEKYPKDVAYNNEVNTAANYFYQTLSAPLINHGYYVLGPLASKQLAANETRSFKKFLNGDIKSYSTRYGVDAILYTIIHRWIEKNGEWNVYVEYVLRSTKTNHELMHTWVKASKQVPTNLKGDPIIMKSDLAFAKAMEFDNGTAQRAFLVEKLNDYILRNIPISSTKRQYEEDLYKSAHPSYIRYVWTDEGKADISPLSIEEYEQECFI